MQTPHAALPFLLLLLLPSRASKPKVIITSLADDYGYHNVGFAHGPSPSNPEARTPHLDLLASTGVILDRMYTYKYCSPTRSSLLSGRLPTHVNQNNLNNDIQAKSGPDLRFTLLPEKFKQAGFTTAMIGKSHLGARSPANLPINRGFDYHFGFLKGGEDHYTQGSGSKHGEKNTLDLWDGHGLSNETGVYSGYLYAQKAVDTIERFASTNTTASGLYLYLAWHNTHTPLECPDEYRYPSWPSFHNSDPHRMTYNCMSRILDDGMSNVTRALKRTGLWDDTLLFFAADNGGWAGTSGANNYPLRGSKVSDFEGGVRVVSFVNGGRHVLPDNVRGTKHTGYISIADWYGTLLNLVGVDPTDDVAGLPPVDSIDVWPSLLVPNATFSGREELWLSWSCDGSNALDPTHCDPNATSMYNTSGDPTAQQSPDDKALIWKQWKIVIGKQNLRGVWFGPVYPNGTSDGTDDSCLGGCLFDIVQDPTEHVNVKDQQPIVWEKMLHRLMNHSTTLYQTNYGEPNVTCMTGKEAAAYYKGHNTCWENRPGFTPSGKSCSNATLRTYLGPMCFKNAPPNVQKGFYNK